MEKKRTMYIKSINSDLSRGCDTLWVKVYSAPSPPSYTALSKEQNVWSSL